MKNLKLAMSIIIYSILFMGCVSKNASSTGATWDDYIPSFLMIAGGIMAAIGGIKWLMNKSEVTGKTKKVFWWGIIIVIAGAAFYLWGY